MSIYKGNNLIAGQPGRPGRPGRPDWAHAVKLTADMLYRYGYTAPSDGIIVGWFKIKDRIAALDCMIEGITIARAAVPTSSDSSEGNVQCPINKGNKLSLKTYVGTITASNITAEICFVPYKAQ